MATPRDNTLGMLLKAESDLFAARAVLATGRALDIVCFHAQQAAEKSLKAVLASLEIEYLWTHNLKRLIDLAAPHLPALDERQQELAMPTPFAVELRYDFEFEPSRQTAEAAVAAAEGVYELARGFLR